MKVFTLCTSFVLSLMVNDTTGFSVVAPGLSVQNQAVSTSPQFTTEFNVSGSNNTLGMAYDGKEGVQLRQSPMKNKMPKHDDGGPVRPIHAVHEFLHEIDNAPHNGLVVVQYHAKWCKVCARVIVKMRQMAQRILSKPTPVPMSFISVEITANQDLCSTLEIKKFPFVQIYRNRECVASFGTGPAHNFQRAVGGTIDEKLAMNNEQWENFRSEFKPQIGEGLEKLEVLKLSAVSERSDLAP